MTDNGPCPYVCGNKSAFGYCLTTVCINPKFKRKYEESQRLLGEYVKIVRCKDCKYFLGSDGECALIVTRLHFYEKDKRWTEESYCSWGERKDDGMDS